MTQKQSGYRLQQDTDDLIGTKVTGPTEAVNENIAIFEGTTGKQIKDSGVPISDVASTGSTIMRVFLRG